MRTLITQATDEQSRDTATELLMQPCVQCKRTTVGIMLLLDHEDAPFCMCADCGQKHNVAIVDVQPKLLAALAEDRYAARTIFLFELARAWNAGKVPLTRKALYNEAKWPQ